MKTISSTDQETFVLDDLHSTPRNATLVKEVLAEAQKLNNAGYKARFTCENKVHQQAVEDMLKDSVDGRKARIYSSSAYDLACQVIQEARKIISMGYNANICCAEPSLDISKEKRKEYYRWKRMNR